MIKKYFYSSNNRNFSIGMIWINGGSCLDKDGKKGINQILCSLLTRGCDGFNNLALSDHIESFGAELNQEVFEDGMIISIKSLNAYFNKLFPLLDLIINKPLLSESQFQTVKNRTLNTIKKEKENPFNTSFEKWRRIVYLNHPYAFNCCGYEKDVLSIKYSDILSEYKRFKKREKYLISNNPKIKDLSAKVLEKSIVKKQITNLGSHLSQAQRFISSENKSSQVILMLGNKTCSFKNLDYLPLKILESHLSYGMSSALFKLFREKNGMTYDVGIYHPIRKDDAPFLIYLSVSNKNALFAFELLIKLWKELLSKSISEDEIFLAKEKLKSSFLFSNQSLDEKLQREIQLMSFKMSAYTYDDYLLKMESISPKYLKDLINKYFSKPFLSVNGEKKICSEIEKKWVTKIIS